MMRLVALLVLCTTLAVHTDAVSPLYHLRSRVQQPVDPALVELAGTVVCIFNGAATDAENTVNVKVIKALAGSATVHEVDTTTLPTISNNKNTVKAAVKAFVTGKGCTDVFFAGHGAVGKWYCSNSKGKNVGTPYQELFDEVKGEVADGSKIHFAGCMCNAGADPKLGLCSPAVIIPFAYKSTNGWLELPALNPFDPTYYQTNYNPIASHLTSAKNIESDLAPMAVFLDTIVKEKGAVGFKTIGGAGAVTTTALSKADWTGPMAQAVSAATKPARSCDMLPECTIS